jgi:hypothetical protein
VVTGPGSPSRRMPADRFGLDWHRGRHLSGELTKPVA